MGSHSYGSPIRRGTMNEIKIGKYCSIAEGLILDGGFSHNTSFISTYPFNHNWPGFENQNGHPVCKGDIIIGNDVWIGEGCMIMSGVTIGNGAIIAARSIVTKDVEAYSMVGGSPAKVLKMRFDDDQIRMLQEIKWWDWSEEKVKSNVKFIMSSDIDHFLSLHL
jgi:acetyltransferase-like isoleucine patch superfamily enzyme